MVVPVVVLEEEAVDAAPVGGEVLNARTCTLLRYLYHHSPTFCTIIVAAHAWLPKCHFA